MNIYVLENSLLFLLICFVFHSPVSSSFRNAVNRNSRTENSTRRKDVLASKSKVDTLGEILKRHVQDLREAKNKQVDIIFLVDSSASVGRTNFLDELKFVRKLLSDFTVDSNHTRVSVITFSSRQRVLRQVDYITDPSENRHKCSLLEEDLPNIRYIGGGTYTLGAFREAKDVLRFARPSSRKTVFLITDGFSNGGDPRPQAKLLRESGVKVFTFGIRNGNVRELQDMASEPKNETCYILDSFEEFEALARRALHEDIHAGSFIKQTDEKCKSLCQGRTPCCDSKATCLCGTHTGSYECVCKPGYYGTGIEGDCHPCPSGTYKVSGSSGDVSTCKKCPDENQMTNTAATDITECSCKKGYRNFNNTGCAALRCPRLKPPKHGYFVNDNCDNVFNAACGIKCKPGFELRGNSLRICQESGDWSGETTQCIMKTCPPLPKPKNGNMICNQDDFSFSTVCRFTCDKGYKLVGSRKRECLAIAFWTGIKTRCREITCQPLPRVRDGIVRPAICTEEEVAFGTTCQIECHGGYTLVGPARKQCTPDGMWAPSADGEMSHCEDTSPPFLMCPVDMTAVAEEDENTAEVYWNVPVALDNSGLIPIMTVVPAIEPPKRIPIGLTFIKYIAEDLNGNKAKCRFSVEVKDITRPRVDICISPPPFVSSTKYANVTWKEPVFTDNSGEDPRVERTHAPGLFPRGVTIVVYTAFDESNNNNTCEIEIKVVPHPCQNPPEPINGRLECSNRKDVVRCKASCLAGYAFAIPPAEEYSCVHDNIWKPSEKLPIPDCSVQSTLNGVVQPASITYLASVPCKQHTILNQIEETFEIKVTQRVNELCQKHTVCEVDKMETTCQEEEGSNAIQIVLGRRKRDSESVLQREVRAVSQPRQNYKPVDTSITFTFNLKGRVSPTGNHGEDYKRQKKLIQNLKKILKTLKIDAGRGTLDIKMDGARMQFANMTYDPSNTEFKCKPGSVLVNTSCVQCPVGSFYNVITKKCHGCKIGTYQPIEGSVSCLVCPTNTSTINNNSKSLNECKAQCLPGTFSVDGLERCSTCDKGFFQNEYGNSACVKCPPRTTTARRGSRQKQQCKEKCVPGYVSRTGLQPCFPCPKDTYQPYTGQTSCFECLPGTFTNKIASTQNIDCEGSWDQPIIHFQSDDGNVKDHPTVKFNECFNNPCLNNATCVSKDFEYTCNCVDGYKGLRCGEEIDQCEAKPCLNNGTCNNLMTDYVCDCYPGFSGKKCEQNINECESSPCSNNGTCIDLNNAFQCICPGGFNGPTCEGIDNLCDTKPCLNNGTCVSEVGGYFCQCVTGFRGKNCEINHDECDSGPCLNGATCEDGLGTYKCQCKPGFTGKNCDKDIDECASSPCPIDVKCEDLLNGFKCHCKKGFAGSTCEEELPNDYMLDFPSSGTFNYSTSTIDVDLTSFTVAFWMRTNDKINQGTPFSYASSDTVDNAMTMTSYDGFVIYINNKKLVTDVAANDGKWHHIVFTWSSNRGSWKIYMDGSPMDQAYDFAVGETIKGGGTFVVGQEQDPGGIYSSTESFVGQLTRLNIWSEELSYSDIEAMRISCQKHTGNIISWPDLQTGLRGSLKPEPSNFCRDCPIPTKPTYGEVSYSNITAGSLVYYTCLQGFGISGIDVRQCLVTSEWENDAPTCERIICGHPGRIKSGYFTGRSYNYGSKVTYLCFKGYELIGNSILSCDEFGFWSSGPPSCQEISCTLPPLSENTRVSVTNSSYKPGQFLTFSCTAGNKLYTEHSTVVCQGDGTWDKSIPTCDPQKCKGVPEIKNAKPTSILPEYSVGYILEYKCRFGFKLSQSNLNKNGQISCLPSGTWESNLPECVLKRCPEPPNVLNAIVNYPSLDLFSIAEYTCENGYVMVGAENKLECIENESWDPLPPSCVPVDCSVPEELKNGVVRADRYTFNSIATYQCDAGYIIVGNKSRTCLADATWSGNVPKCNPISCGKPSLVKNGFSTGKEFTLGKTIKYGCSAGYVLSGITDRICGVNGQWTGAPPVCNKIKCQAHPELKNGFYTSTGQYYDDTVKYECNVGFILNGNDTAKCQTDGSWFPALPQCNPVKCPPINDILNGNFTSTGITFSDRVEYFCDEGYEMDGETIRICQPDRTWSGKEPRCFPGKCAPPPQIDNGKTDYKDLTLGSVALYTCNPGYTLTGMDVRRCLQNLTWNGGEPVCVPKSCLEPKDITNGYKILSGLLYNAVVKFGCDPGYTLKGHSELTCTKSGKWSGDNPYCEIVICDSPSRVISNGRMNGDTFTYGSTISYVCDPGYKLEGSVNRTCLSTGEWSTKLPVCEAVECPRPSIRNGFPSTFKREYDTRITFDCYRGYVLFGPPERRCLEDGSWSGLEPICVKCSRLQNPEFGSVTIKDKTATFTCQDGFKIKGNSTLQCQKDGSWNGGPPRCAPENCDLDQLALDVFSNGKVEVKDRHVGAVAIFSCDVGYSLQGVISRQCLASGSWSGSNPECVKVKCGGSFTIHNGRIIGFDNSYQANITFHCQEGYKLEGNEYVTCTANGSWSGSAPVCNLITCSAPEDINNGQVTYSTLDYGGELLYQCDIGYRIDGENFRRCLGTGIWSGRSPKCVEMSCPVLEKLANGKILGNDRSFGSQVRYECNTGYILEGISRRLCLINGKWSSVKPSCKAKTCPDPPVIENGFIGSEARSVFQFGSIVQYFCHDGFKMKESNSDIVCEANGLWAGQVPVCGIVTCPLPENVVNADVNYGSLSFNNTVTYKCKNGFTINGENTRRCLNTGVWSGKAPTCKQTSCLHPPDFENGQITVSGYSVGSQLHYKCNDGYTLVGFSFRLCLITLKWSGPDPSCKPIKCPYPKDIANGFINANGRTEFHYGDMIQYTCNEGFELSGENSDSTCLASSLWSAKLPTCSKITCGQFPIIPYTSIIFLNRTSFFGDMVEIKCKEGYRSDRITNSLSTCQANGVWSDVNIRCTTVQCLESPNIPYANISKGNFYAGDILTVRCQIGYAQGGTNSITCLQNGTWSSTAYSTCKIITCEDPSGFENGIAEYSGLAYGSEADYRCKPGYQLKGPKNRTCNEQGKWTGPNPVCEQIVCANPPSVQNAKPITSKTKFNVDYTFNYSCIRGFKTTGNKSLKCSSNGIWLGTLPLCQKITCPKPDSPRNGFVNFVDLFFESTVSFDCNSGFELQGYSNGVCLETGHWSVETPICAPVNCGAPKSDPNAYAIGDLYTLRNRITYFCDDGYNLVGEQNIVCTVDGTWSDDAPHCIPVNCGLPPEISQASAIGTVFTYLNTVLYKCDKGYKNSGNDILECGADGKWKGSKPVCNPVTCGPPPVLMHSTTTVTRTTYGGTVTYVCNRGYTLQGDPMSMCSENGIWLIDPTIACLPKDCGDPEILVHGSRTYNSTTYQSVVYYSCKTGYGLRGNGTLQCGETGTWIGGVPTCVAEDCGEPFVNKNVLIVDRDTSVGGTTRFKCSYGHVMVGQARIDCTELGQWSGSPPQCLRVNCPPLEIRTEGLIMVDGSKREFLYGDTINFSCEAGYIMKGRSDIVCTETGIWNANMPDCSKLNITLKYCPLDSGVPNSRSLSAKQEVGKTVTVQCADGYNSVGDMKIICTKTETWSRINGYCKRVFCGKPRLNDFVNVIRVQGRSYFYGDKVRYRCRPGILPSRLPPVVKCTASGRWDGNISCSLPCKGGCKNGGRCIGLYGCKCPPGFGGRRCEKAICILPCLNSGRCVAPYKCSCPTGYSGSRCQNPICDQPCANGGRCIKHNRCQCLFGFKPPFCKTYTFLPTANKPPGTKLNHVKQP